MRQFLLGLATGLLVIALVVIAAPTVFEWWIERPPRVPKGATLTLHLGGAIPEAAPASLSPFDPPALTTFAIWDVLRKAAVDPRIAAVWLEPDKPGAGWAKLHEIREAILAFRKQGKPVFAYLRTPNARDYYLASAADRISVQPADFVDLKGLRAELLYARTALDKLGIVAEVEAIGRYKDGADIATRSSMSPETREVMNSILDARYQELTNAIAAGRNKNVEQTKSIIDEGPYLAPAAQKAGLVDAVEFSDQAEKALAQKLGQSELKKVSAREYQKVPAGDVGLGGQPRIAILAAEGDIAREPVPYFADEVLSPSDFAPVAKQLRQDTRIRGVVVRIDSPGGDAIASEELLRHLRLLAEKKPVVISMVDIAASGGYELAMGGQSVIADPATITGSIGVFYGKANLGGLYEKLGLHKEIMQRGRYAAIDSDARGLTPDERTKLHSLISESYTQFVTQVANTRKRSYDEIDKVAQGRVWLGSQARERGLVDELGGLAKAFEIIKQKAGIAPGEKITVEVYPKRPGLVASIEKKLKPYVGGSAHGFAATGRLWKRVPWNVEVR